MGILSAIVYILSSVGIRTDFDPDDAHGLPPFESR
jgi:cation transporter-like permease